MSLGQSVWDDLHERYGADLRVVIRYDPTQFDTYLREDVRDSYTDEELRTIVDDVIVEQLSLTRKERDLKTGRLHSVVRIYDDAWVVIWPDEIDAKSGFIVAVQRDGDAGVGCVEAITDYLESEVAPELT
ncbi:MAG: hypothetical protein ABEJ31_08040 [Haloarculaceae archaeon]